MLRRIDSFSPKSSPIETHHPPTQIKPDNLVLLYDGGFLDLRWDVATEGRCCFK
ncbi:hypothetical protein Hanom_Chr16g01510781 [Helianthus anomalus]